MWVWNNGVWGSSINNLLCNKTLTVELLLQFWVDLFFSVLLRWVHSCFCLSWVLLSVSQDSNRTHVPRYINPKSILLDPNIMMTEDSVKTVETEDESTMNKITEPKGAKLFSAMLCCYTAFDFDDPALLGRQRNDCICINQRAWYERIHFLF